MKIFRYLNALAILALVGSAVYAYSISYQTLFYSAQIDKLKDQIQHQRDDIAMLRAEWAHRVRPQRLQELSDKYLDLQHLALNQIVTLNDLPDRAPRVDTIGNELHALGFSGATATPKQRVPDASSTPQR